MKNRKLIATIFSNAIHNEQVLCAAKLWADHNSIDFVLHCKKQVNPYYVTVVLVKYDGRTILFDMSDSPELVDVEDDISTYYKRSYVKNDSYDIHSYPVLPFGFNYGVTNNLFSLNRISAFGFDKVYTARSLPILNRLTNLSYSHIYYKRMHDIPRDNGGTILFLTRLWDPATVSSEEKKTFRKHLNAVRIETVKNLKQKFKGRLIAGIANTPLACKLCPELIVPSNISSKGNYIKSLRNADICVATNGLENTLGWRIAEYVAFSKAVVSEPFHITVPNWNEGQHYLLFDTDLNEKIDALLYNKNYLQMQQQNY